MPAVLRFLFASAHIMGHFAFPCFALNNDPAVFPRIARMTRKQFYGELLKRTSHGAWPWVHGAEVVLAFVFGVLALKPDIEHAWRPLLAIPAVIFLVFFLIGPYWHAYSIYREAATGRQPGVVLLQQLNLQAVDFERTAEPKIVYKSKLRIVFKNDTGRDLAVQTPAWQTKPGEVPFQPPPVWPWQVESGKGWTNEAPSAEVRPGQVFRTWIGLDQSVSQDELRRRHNVLQLGSLVFRVTIAGLEVTHEIRL